MPSAAQARGVDVSNMRRLPVEPIAPIKPPLPPEPPQHLKLSPVFISSMPAMSTDVDGITRQFYGRPNLPTRRVITP